MSLPQNGETPVYLAAVEGSKSAVILLLEARMAVEFDPVVTYEVTHFRCPSS